MRAVTIAKATAWTVIPLVIAEPIASAVFAGGMFGTFPPWKLTVGQALTAIPRYLWYFPSSPEVLRWTAIGSGAGLAVVAVPTLYLAYAFHQRRRRLREARPGEPTAEPVRAASRAHGDADWLTMEDATDIFPGEHPDWGGIPVGEAYRPDLDRTARRPFDESRRETWGRGGKAPLLLSPLTTGAIGGIIIAGSGSFKTVAFTLPAMCTWRGSAVVNDPSLQVGPMVANVRRAMGHQVVMIDPANPHLGGFNPLACIDITHPLAPLHVEDFVGWCSAPPNEKVEGSGEGKDFSEWGKELECCFLADLLWDSSGPKTLREWRSRLVTPEAEMRNRLASIYANSASRYARDLAGTLMRVHPKTFSGVYRHATSNTKFLSIPAYADLMSGDSFDPSDLTRGKLTVILQISDDAMKATPAVARIIIGSLARTVLRARGHVATPIPFILDEMDLLGSMPILATMRDMGRKSGAALFPMWQSIGQIEDTWGKGGKTSWYASAGWRLYAAINDPETAAEVSKRCGTYTVLARTEGTSISSQNALSNGSRTRGVNGNTSEQRFELLSAYDAQTTLRPDEAIIIPKGRRALRCGRPLFWRRPEMASQISADQFRRTPQPSEAV